MTKSDEQVEQFLDNVVAQSVSVTTVRDGWVLSFSEEALKALLRYAQKTGKVIVFVKHQEKVL